MAGPDVPTIVAMLGQRQRDRGEQLEGMRRIRDAYNGDIVIPLPELDRNELPAVINFVNTGLDQMAARVASVTPDVYYPPLREGFQTSMERARTRRRATLSWWQTNRMDAKLSRRARFLIGYAESPVSLRPDSKRGIARWQVRNPLSSYPALSGDLDDLQPSDCIFTFQRSLGWLRQNYPVQTSLLNTGADPITGVRPDPTTKFDVVEYVDGDVFVLVALGKNVNPSNVQPGYPGSGLPFVELERLPNRTGECPVSVPGRITLDRPMGQFDGMIGMYQTMAKLTALEIVAVERGIFPTSFLISRPNETARFLSGPYDGRTGLVNIVAGGDIKETAPNPGFATTNTIDRIERAARATGGIPAEFGGESPTNVRTGKRGDAVMAGIVEMPIAEAQQALAASLEVENRIAVAIAKNYFGNERKSFYLSGKNPGHVDYVPNRDFETDVNRVSYPLPGVDQNGLMIGIGQRIGVGTMSKETGAELDPLVADPQLEKRRITAETLDAAILGAIAQQAASGQITPADAARLKQLTATGMSIEDAVTAVQKEAQLRQATPVQPDEPEAQPGLAQPGMGQEQPAIQGPNPSQDNLAMLLNSLRRPVKETPQEQGAAA